jgi:hypothetical protein
MGLITNNITYLAYIWNVSEKSTQKSISNYKSGKNKRIEKIK